MNEQNQYNAQRERHTAHQPKGSTMEVVQLEKQNAPLPSWQRVVVSALAVIGLLAIIGAIVLAIAGR